MQFALFVALLIALFASFAISTPTQLKYNLGQVYEYSVKGDVDARGKQGSARTHGDTSTMEGILLAKPIKEDSESYVFVMNMYDVKVGVGQSNLLGSSSNDQPLGYTMYFEQQKSGQITKIWYHTLDKPYFVNIKVAAINAFQTKVVAPAQVMRIEESDPVGLHFAEAKGSAQSDALIITKTFNTEDVQKFADVNTKKQNVQLQSLTTTAVHQAGHIQSATIEQQVVFKKHGSGNGQDDTSAFNTALSSQGKLTITQVTSKNAHRLSVAFEEMENYETSTMMKWAGSLAAITSEIAQEPEELMNASMKPLKFSGKVRRQLRKLMVLVNKDQTLISKLLQPLMNKYEDLLDHQKDRILYLLSGLESKLAHGYIVTLIKKEPMRGMIAAAGMSKPSELIFEAIWEAYHQHHTSQDIFHRNVALFSYGTLISRLEDEHLKQSKILVLTHEVDRVSKSGDVQHLVALLYAFKNAEVQIPQEALRNMSKEQADEVHLHFKSTVPTVDEFPFQKDYKYNYTVGSDMAGAVFKAELFAGSSKVCSGEKYFNYKALAQATGDGHVFGTDFNLLTARALYAKKDGVQVGNQIFLSVFDKVYFDKKFPVLDCSAHKFPIKKFTLPGFHLSQTVFVSIIPVTFEVGVDATVDLEFGWQICDSNLTAMVEFIPKVDLVASGDAEINLLIVKAGLELDLDLNAALVPQVTAEGMECAVKFDLDLQCAPQTAVFEAFYMVKKCKFLFFDCHWEPKNVYKIFDYKSGSFEKVIYEHSFPIKI